MATKDEWARAHAMALKNLREMTPAEDAKITADALNDRDARPVDELIRRAGKALRDIPDS